MRRIRELAGLAAALLVGFAGSAGADLACVSAPYERDGSGTADAVADMLEAIAPAREASPSLFEALEGSAPDICLLPGPLIIHGYYEVETNRIAVHADLGAGGGAAVLLHELRHLDQFRRGYCAGNDYSMEETARSVMAFEADAMATTAAAAWALREAGQTETWAFLSEEWSRYADIAATYEAAREAGSSAREGMEAAFAAWFGSEWRIQTYMLSSCFDYLDREDERHLTRGADLLPPGYLAGLCTLQDGSGYSCAVPEALGR